jgi:biotin-dependent carboxylase-like uncharacterized protein
VNAIEVTAPGLLTTVQDLVGRAAYNRYGVPDSGPLDPLAAEAANRLVGNPREAALLELTVSGPTLRFDAPATVALVGAELPATLDGRPVPAGRSLRVTAGATLTVGERRQGARAYLAVAGGIEIPHVLGSRSTDVRTGLGGKPLRAGDRLPVGAPLTAVASRQLAARLPLDGPIRILPGPHLNLLQPDALERLCSAEWRVDHRSDRQGCRLAGPPLAGGEIATLGLPPGAVQLPPDGQPILLLADRQPTGGYPVLAVVIEADLRLVGQRTPGDALRFRLVDAAEAIGARAEASRLLTVLEPGEDDPLAWAGALD